MTVADTYGNTIESIGSDKAVKITSTGGTITAATSAGTTYTSATLTTSK